MLIREKFVSEDEKLLNTFKKITEMNASKMISKPVYGTKKKEASSQSPNGSISSHIEYILNP
jgi:hypothetical protein